MVLDIKGINVRATVLSVGLAGLVGLLEISRGRGVSEFS